MTGEGTKIGFWGQGREHRAPGLEKAKRKGAARRRVDQCHGRQWDGTGGKGGV